MTDKMTFKPAPGGFLTEEQAQIYGERLYELQEENSGKIDADTVVNDAQYQSSPLHDYFEWDDTEAGKKWRLQQARVMIGGIYITVKVNEKEEDVRAFQHLSFKISEKETETAYTTTIRAMSEPELRQQMIEKALRELNSWRKRYNQYRELGKVFAAIEVVQQELEIAQ